MKKLPIALPLIALLSLSLVAFAQGPGGGPGTGGGPSLDAAEEVHLLFMRAEEKLAHDIYLALGEEFHEMVESTIDWRPFSQEDIQAMGFYAWLKSKMMNRDFYSTWIELSKGVD